MPITHLAAVAVVSLFGFLAGLLMIAAYKNAEAAIVAPMQYSQIVWASIYGVLFFDEQIDSITFLGASIIISSGLYIVFREQAGGTSTNTPVLRSRSRGYGSTFRISPFLPRSRRK